MVKFKEIVFLRKTLKPFFQIWIYLMGEEKFESYWFKKALGYKPNFNYPQTLNEKIAWLKIHYYEDYYRTACDKLSIHYFLKDNVGKDYAAPLIFATKHYKNLNFTNITEFPCIIKTSNGSGQNLIVKSKDQYTEEQIQKRFRLNIVKSNTHAISSLEHQYVSSKPDIIVEKLLKDSNGGIPNDYKFVCINGNIEFIYCSVDRLGSNVRHVYDINWERLHFIWVAGANEELFQKYEQSNSITKPVHFEEMKDLAVKIAKLFPLVRIDFYDTSDGIYIGEITLHHGSGHDAFYPESYDLYYGQKLILPVANQ